MSNNGPPGMMVWISETIAATHHLTTVQFGAWSRLRMAAWRNSGSLPNDEVRLARTAGLPLDKWRKISGPVLEMFTVEGDRIVGIGSSKNSKRQLA